MPKRRAEAIVDCDIRERQLQKGGSACVTLWVPAVCPQRQRVSGPLIPAEVQRRDVFTPKVHHVALQHQASNLSKPTEQSQAAAGLLVGVQSEIAAHL